MSKAGLGVVDLTHPLDENMPIWPGDPEFKLVSQASYGKDGYLTHRMAVGEHSGTHWGTPNTFLEGGRSADMFTPEELVVPAVVIDIRAIACHDRDYSLTVREVTAWERDNGRIPRGSVVILFTGWQEKWNDPRAFFGMDDDTAMHWPGFGKDAVNHMIQERGIAALEPIPTVQIRVMTESSRQAVPFMGRMGWSLNVWQALTGCRLQGQPL